MMVGSARLLTDLLRHCRWGLEQDFGYRWTLSAGAGEVPAGLFSLHLRTDPTDDDAPGLLYAREIGIRTGDDRGILLHAAVSVTRTEALTAAVLDDRGAGDLVALAALLDASDQPAVPAAA